MMTTVAVLLLLGLIVFGPKKTIEFAQEIAKLIAHAKHALGEMEHSTRVPPRRPETA